MKKPVFIVISGKKQHGKSTAAEVIKNFFEGYGKKVVITAFAEPLKKFCSDVFGIPLEDMETEEGKQKFTTLKWSELQREAIVQDDYIYKQGFLTVRELLQYFGTNICRNRFYGQIWATAPFKKQWDADVVIVPDCRFGNELQAAKDNNAACIIRVQRTNYPSNDTHISETALDDVVWQNNELILNSSSLEDFKQRVRKYLDSKTIG